ncbi:MAG: hypothetical protein ACREA0_09295, partial [bacterium]
MPSIRYTRWNGNSAASPGAEQVFDQLSNHLNETGDLQQAMRRLMQRGLKHGEEQVPGLDDLLSQIAREIRRLYDRYQIHSALDQVGEKLESIVAQERRALERLRETRPDIEEKEKFLDRVPKKSSEAIERLASYDFEDPNAESEFQELLAQLDQVQRLEHYIRREGSLFRGHTPLDLKESQDLMERMGGLRRLEAQLSSTRPQDVDADLLRKLLGSDAQMEFEGVMRLESLLEEGGYVIDRGDHFELAPRGIRRIGQLALRDIYKQLSREGMGRHPLPRSGAQERNTEDSKPYVAGDPLNLNMIQTLKNTLLRETGVPLH